MASSGRSNACLIVQSPYSVGCKINVFGVEWSEVIHNLPVNLCKHSCCDEYVTFIMNIYLIMNFITAWTCNSNSKTWVFQSPLICLGWIFWSWIYKQQRLYSTPTIKCNFMWQTPIKFEHTIQSYHRVQVTESPLRWYPTHSLTPPDYTKWLVFSKSILVLNFKPELILIRTWRLKLSMTMDSMTFILYLWKVE